MKLYAGVALILMIMPGLGIAGDNLFRIHNQSYSQPMLLAAAGATKFRLTAGQAASKVKKRYGGKILSSGLSKSKGKPVYRVKLLTKSGVVKIVYVDPNSGRIYE
jgi:uncharacterized membrane protein YkoI